MVRYNDRKIEKKFEFEFKEKGFVDHKGNLREELMTVEAERIAKYFKENKLSKSQLRAFFNEVKAINNKLKSSKNENKFEEIYPLILMLKSKVAYRQSKEKRKMKGIKEFLDLSIEEIRKENKKGNGKKTFENFVIFFEVIVGYSYGMLNE